MIITCPNCATRYSLPQDKIKPGGQKVRCAKCGTVWHQAPEDAPPALTPEDQVPAPPPPPDPAWAPVTPAEPAPPTVQPPIVPPPIVPPVPPETPPIAEPAPGEPPAAVESPAVAPPAAPPAGFSQFHVSTGEEETSGKGRKIAIAVIVLVVLALGALVAFKQQIQDLTGIPLMSSSPAEAPPAAPAAPVPPPEPKAPQVLTLTFDEVESSIEEIDGIKRLLVKGVIVNPADHEQVVPALAFNMLDKDGKAIDRWTFPAPVRALAPHTTTRFSSQRDTPPVALVELVPGFDVPENPPPVIEPPAGAAATPGAPSPAAPAAGAARPASPPVAAPAPARPPTSQQTPAPIE